MQKLEAAIRILNYNNFSFFVCVCVFFSCLLAEDEEEKRSGKD